MIFFCSHMQTSNDSKIRQNYHCVLAKALNRNSGPTDKKGTMKENGVRSVILGWMGILRSRKSSSQISCAAMKTVILTKEEGREVSNVYVIRNARHPPRELRSLSRAVKMVRKYGMHYLLPQMISNPKLTLCAVWPKMLISGLKESFIFS